MEAKNNTLHVLMFPWLAHGHISPYLELAKKLSQRNFRISFCSTPINLLSIKKHLEEQRFFSIQLVELHLPSLPNLPPHYHTTKSLPPHLMPALNEAFNMAKPSFSYLFSVLKPDLLIYDYMQPWAPAVASEQKVPAVHFLTSGATWGSYCIHILRNQSNNQFPFPELCLHDHEYEKTMDEFNTGSNTDRFLNCLDASSNLMLVKTFREIEGNQIDYFSSQMRKEIVPVGPLVQEPTRDDHEHETLKIMAWLDEKDKSSVVFVSCGSEYFMSNEEMEELAYGLELSKVSFIWVVRLPKGEEAGIDEILPKGVLERIEERGMVVKDWAPQAKILAHGSIGGFVSHCGWSSVMEAFHYGVPVIGLPMQLDEPINARLAVEIGVGMEIQRRNAKIVREEVAKVIREVVIEKKGGEIRKRAKEFGEKMRKKGEEELDMVVEKLIQICEDNNN